MTDRRRRAAASDSTSREDNPFAPPPEGQPDQPWEPRVSRSSGSSGSSDGDDSGSGSGNGSGGGGNGDSGSSEGEQQPSGWGSQWSSKQPGRHGGGFGGGPGTSGGGNGGGGGPSRGGQGPGGPGGPGGSRGMRWDPTDPLQRHARYSLHSGIWGLFFALLSVPQVALLLGALSLYWGINALRGKLPKSATAKADRTSKGGKGGKRGRRGPAATAEDVAGTSRGPERDDAAGAGARAGDGKDGRPPVPLAVTPAQADKAKRTAAISGLVTASLTLMIVAATFSFQFVYSDYYTCQNDALTQSSRDDCKRHLPEELRPFLEDR
ncbi:hypothetical protein JW613_30045 [Streptomyces smyrnaeus]|uniref:Integral membrane protein n=1 Tax=Streptomyces smyrnaeus TaxID=1387713 RepID=A0ABS3Y4R9_9ACTN|nr:hypothetical protein [Streptomyces smyrnaeus]MBO8202493.1 hypothetical protein [Streptomyces smyrnaeus]